MKKEYVIWGSKGHAKVLADTLSLLGQRLSALFDNDPKTTSAIPGIKIYHGPKGFHQWRKNESKPSTKYFGLVAIGGTRGIDRLKIQEFFEAQSIVVPALIHPSASIAPSSKVFPGAQILSQAMIASDCVIREGCIINNRSGIDHECFIGKGCHIAPGATLCGEVMLEENVLIGAGAVILPKLTVGSNTVVGAGSVVTKSLPANIVVCGNPAKIIKRIPIPR